MPASVVVAVPRMRARSLGAREMVGARGAILRADDNCVRVCPPVGVSCSGRVRLMLAAVVVAGVRAGIRVRP
ncbi:hypothetical protein CH277_16760 [Rhodococcus sp. 06-469-3-2]|nr:hypothetical protein CH277_16760 [Rhodococcus sp. 06-469-3-2]